MAFKPSKVVAFFALESGELAWRRLLRKLLNMTQAKRAIVAARPVKSATKTPSLIRSNLGKAGEPVFVPAGKRLAGLPGADHRKFQHDIAALSARRKSQPSRP